MCYCTTRFVATVTNIPHVRVIHTVNLLNTSLSMNLTRKIQSNIIKSTHLYSFTINTHLYRSYIYTLIYIVHILYPHSIPPVCSPQHNGLCTHTGNSINPNIHTVARGIGGGVVSRSQQSILQNTSKFKQIENSPLCSDGSACMYAEWPYCAYSLYASSYYMRIYLFTFPQFYNSTFPIAPSSALLYTNVNAIQLRGSP